MMSEPYSPFGRDSRSVHLTEQDEALLKGEYPHSFHATDWIEITGRGTVAVIENDDEINPRPLTGKIVLIDGKEYRVRGVETFRVPDWSVHRHPFGLLVTPAEDS